MGRALTLAARRCPQWWQTWTPAISSFYCWKINWKKQKNRQR